ncbi:MAG: hypothetical protein WBG66_11670 [Geitlerinemataceae cyanobacterium]
MGDRSGKVKVLLPRDRIQGGQFPEKSRFGRKVTGLSYSFPEGIAKEYSYGTLLADDAG